MATTKELQISAVANNIMGLAAALAGVKLQIDATSTAWTNLSAAAALNAFPTAAATTTGGIGTVDTTPVTTNPINVTVAPGTELNRAMSSTQIAGLLTYLQGVSTAIGGGAVSANGAAAQLVALTL